MKAAGGDCKLIPFEGADHGFFNSPDFRKGSSEDRYQQILLDVDRFLARLGLE